MRLLTLLLGMLLFIFTSTISATSVNGRFVIVHKDSTKLSVLLQINTNSGTDAMGGATIVLGFDTTAIKFKSSPVKNIDYLFHNFCSGSYSAGTVTKPMNDKIWVNIYLPIDNTNEGCIVAQTDSWTDAVTINFDIKDPDGKASFYWLTNSIFWGIYDDDNKTLWDDGVFENKTDLSLTVELSSFTAALLGNKNVLLNWSTVSSGNSTGFEIEKRASSSPASAPVGTTPVQDWEKIGFVESAGNSNVSVDYSFTDVTPHKSAVVQYRLKIVNIDGTFSYSNVVEVQTAPMSFELSQNYPNPFNPSTKIVVKLPHTADMKLVVYNLLGEIVSELANAEYQAGTHEFNFDAAGLASGVYIYRIESANYTDTKKMVLLR